MTVERHVAEPRRIAGIELDPADGMGLGRVLRALGARLERRTDATDEVDARIVGLGQLDCYLTRAHIAPFAHCLCLRGTPRPTAGTGSAKHCGVCRPWSNGV